MIHRDVNLAVLARIAGDSPLYDSLAHDTSDVLVCLVEFSTEFSTAYSESGSMNNRRRSSFSVCLAAV